MPLIKLLRGFGLQGLFLTIVISTSLGPPAKIINPPCSELQGLDSEGQLCPISAPYGSSQMEASVLQ